MLKNKKIRLVIDAQPMAEARISGIGHMTLELVRALDRLSEHDHRFEVVLAVSADKIGNIRKYGLKNVTLKKIPLSTRVLNLLWKYDFLPPMDIFLGKGVYVFPNYKNWPLLKAKSITYVCDIGYLLFPDFVEPRNLEFLKKNMSKWTGRTDRIASISRDARDDIISHLNVPADRVAYVPCGVDGEVFYRRGATEVDAVRQNYGLSEKYILYIGNIEPRKNILSLIEAYKLLPQPVREEYSLVLVGGGGWKNEEILSEIDRAAAEGYKVVKTTKYVIDNDLPALYSGAAALTHVALYEGFGISPLQAMACGTPVVVANNSSLPEVVGDAGLCADASSPKDISDKIEIILTDKNTRTEKVRAGLERAKDYTWLAAAEKLLEEARKLR